MNSDNNRFVHIARLLTINKIYLYNENRIEFGVPGKIIVSLSYVTKSMGRKTIKIILRNGMYYSYFTLKLFSFRFCVWRYYSEDNYTRYILR